ncbi:alternative ribosome rescue aminoacyl-tRNA hydrolase ArfB [Christiangramia sp.]|uniref:alternative ribosome rescue aminoacyl-tRNA hydrolase ArfB n=1 Tax=Christiangramia sp. TaxID=1931228 RepID=UPI0026231EFA|nr:alternative ribosome rescue aminoacyl-tRNA hydrolase ArfB [Christiangramia sp.]
MDQEIILNELDYKAVRSSGPGGQHANKTATKVELSFDIANSEGLSEQEKKRIFLKLAARINKEGILKMNIEDSRSQHTNKNIVTENFFTEIEKALEKAKPRKKTKPTKASKIKRLNAKKRKSEIKSNRKDPLK